MTTVRPLAALALAATLAAPAAAQEFPKPGPEHEVLKKMVGTWETTTTFGGMESKGTCVYKLDLNGLWLAGALEGEMFGGKFAGRSLDGYDPAKKKYVSVWVDNMSSSPMLMEGDYDKAAKTLTMVGDGPGPDGKPTKFKGVTTMPDDDTIRFTMFVGGATEPAFTMVYKRKK